MLLAIAFSNVHGRHGVAEPKLVQHYEMSMLDYSDGEDEDEDDSDLSGAWCSTCHSFH